MVTFGLDISHHQDLGLNLAQARRESIEFVFIKATEGATFYDPEFAPNLAEARAAGQLVAAYHYLKSNASAAAQVANVARVVPKSVPIIPDVEANSGGVALVREFVDKLRAAGYRVPLLYLPRWYWQQLGSPDLRGLPALWSSRYPDNVVGTLGSEWAAAPASYWNGYGGLPVAVLQFTSSARVAGHQPLDANAFNGTRDQLAIVLGGGTEDELSWNDPVVDPRTNQPARDFYGNAYDQNTQAFYSNRAIGDVREHTTERWYTYDIASGKKKEAPAPTEAERQAGKVGGRVPAKLLDELDGQYLIQEIQRIATGGVDLDQLADKVAARLGASLAQAINDEADRRARDANPDTGPRT